MTHTEILAFNSGLLTAADLATQSADALRARLTERPTRYAYAIEALDAVADEARLLTKPLPPDDAEPSSATLPKPHTPGGPSSVAAAMEVA